MKKSLYLIVLVLAVVLGLVGIKAWRLQSRQLEVVPVAPLLLDENALAGRLASALRFHTISSLDRPEQNADEFRKLHAYLQKNYPRTHGALKRELIGGYSLLYTWTGTAPGARPIMLMAHQDVVPVALKTGQDWQMPPFAGVVKDGFIWGRGSWDNKGNLFAMMEAVERLVSEGFSPKRTVYLTFGHDEEVGGQNGAKAISAMLKSRGVKLDYVLDEGLLIAEGILKGLDKPAALIGIAEKGYATVLLNVKADPVHSSMPPQKTAIGMMSRALARIEDKPLPADIRDAPLEMFETLAPEMSGFNRVVLANLWLFKPLLMRELEKSVSTNAMLRTTTALTIVHAGNKDNVLPAKAEAAVNFRLLPGDTEADIVLHVRQAVADDDIKLTTSSGNAEASRVSRTDVPAYQTINRTVREVFPGTVVAPGLMIGATDARHFADISDNTYRFSPVRAQTEDLPRFHGSNERISVKNYAEMVRFYHRLLINGSN